MRIISGKYKGKKIEGFEIIGTRPTMDRVKESLFGIIQNDIKGSTCLDLFAGSGSLGFEAISNGSLKCFFVDKNDIVINTLNKNIKQMNLEEEIIVLKNDYQDALLYFYNNKIKFDIIFLDPPYDYNLIQSALNKIVEYDIININGIIICEYERESFTCCFKNIKEKRYGTKNIIIYKKL